MTGPDVRFGGANPSYRAGVWIAIAALFVALVTLYENTMPEAELAASISFEQIAEIEVLLADRAFDEAARRLEEMPSGEHVEHLPLLHNLLGNAYAGRQQAQAAIEQYRRAIELDPSFADAYNNLGVALARSDRLVAAIVAFEQALDARADFSEALDNLARAVGLLEREAESLDTEGRAVLERARSRLAADRRADR